MAPPLTVTRIVDGDTVDLSEGRRVRVLGIDTPQRGDCGFEQASEFARTTLLGREVDVTTDPTQDAVDQYGRALLYIGSPGSEVSWGRTAVARIACSWVGGVGGVVAAVEGECAGHRRPRR
jgi:endonuclease YncB( thermonuclease family)